MHIDDTLFRIVTIDKIIQETPSVKTIFFRDRFSSIAKPGQFLMVWIPRKEELPLSIMISDEIDSAAITIRKYGYGSTALFGMKEGDKLGIRGPYGNSFVVKENYRNIVMLGGGTGVVPLIRLLSTLKNREMDLSIIIGARTKNEFFYVDTIKSIMKGQKIKIYTTTEDGSSGEKGYPTDLLKKLISKNDIDIIYTCGPELMMKKAFEISSEKKVSIQASIERYMKCGIGICSSCCINDKLVCTDGTIFDESQLKHLTEFGKNYRNKAGILCEYQ